MNNEMIRPVRRAMVSCLMRLTLTSCFLVGPALAGLGAETPSISRFITSRLDLPAQALSVSEAFEGVITGPSVDRFEVRLRAGDFAAVDVVQTGGNIVAVVFDPQGQRIDIVDHCGKGAVESVTINAKRTGLYTIQTAMFEWDAVPAAYAIELKRVEPAARTPSAMVDQLLTSWYDASHPGAAVAIVEKGKIVYKRTIGLANVEDSIPISADTRFDLASVSKQFTAFAVAMLLERGALTLDDDVRTFVPEVPNFGSTITIRHLLEHTSGLRDWDAPFGLKGLDIEDGITVPQILDFVSRQRDLGSRPGERQQYSNTGYNLLAVVIARVTRQPFDAWLKANVFAPAGMSAIAVTEPDTVVPSKAHSYHGRVPAPQLVSAAPTAAAGSSSLHASLNDMVAWVRNFETGAAGGGAVIRRVSARAEAAGNGPSDYVFGQWFGERQGLQTVGHLGLAAGFRVSLRRFPERGLAVIYMANDGNDATYARAELVENLFLGTPENPVPAPRREYRPEPAAPPPDTPTFYSGLYYSDELQTLYELRVSNGGLWAAHAVNGTIPLHPVNADTFATDRWFMPVLNFVHEPSGAISGFTVSTEGAPNMFFRKLKN